MPETCKDRSPSGPEMLVNTVDLEGGLVPLVHTSPCRLSTTNKVISYQVIQLIDPKMYTEPNSSSVSEVK